METPKLKQVYRLDSMPLAEWTPEGFLVDKPIVTSCGIFEYHNDDGSVRKELRLPENVFDPESLATYKGKPVIITHDARMVTSENTARETIGTILSEGLRDGDDVRVEIVIHDTNRMKRENLKELSLGYKLTLDETPGEWNGQHYDAIQTDIRINHLALVKQARAGEEARLNIDGKDEETIKLTGGKAMKKDKALTADEAKKAIAGYKKRQQARLDGADEPSAIPEKIIIEGIVKPQTTATDAEPAEGDTKEMTLEEKVQEVKDRRDRRDQAGDPEDVEGAKGVIAQQDEDLSVALELLEKLQAAKDMGVPPVVDNQDADEPKPEPPKPEQMNADSVDVIVTERLRLARIGDKLNLDGIELMKPIDAQKKIIAAIKPEVRLDGKSAGYIETAFDIAVNEYNSRKPTNVQRRQMFNTDSADTSNFGKSKAQQAREKMLERIKNGGGK